MSRQARRTAAAALLAGLALAGCSTSTGSPAGSGSPNADTNSATSSTAASTTLTVFAAASLKESFTELETVYEKAHPGVDVRFNFGGSSTLAQQIVSGAPADVFAAASDATMATVVEAKQAASPTTFARNELQIAVPPSNPAKVTGLASLGSSSLKLALCQADVPCGAASTKLFARAGIAPHPATLEPDVKSVLTKVSLDEADAGIVYVSDVRAAGASVKGIAIPSASNVQTNYPIAALTGSHDAAAAQQFVALVTSEQGRQVLVAHGFLPA